MADTWFTGCTYTRLTPPELSSLTETDPVVQFLQNMPYGTAARSLEARMQRLLLVATAKSALLLMQWSEKPKCKPPAFGNLLLVDEVLLPSPVLQFVRQEPKNAPFGGLDGCSFAENFARLMRAFPWEGENLVKSAGTRTRAVHKRGSTSDSECRANLRTSKTDLQKQPKAKLTTGCESISLVRDFPTYGVGLVLRNSGNVLHSLNFNAERHQRIDPAEGQLLAITPLPALRGGLASLVSNTRQAPFRNS